VKVAIATENGYVSAHFGRCPAYTLVDIEDGKVVGRQEIPNPGHSPGFLPGYLSEKGVDVIIAGGMGPRAQGLFADNNIQTITGVQGKIDEVIERFISQRLEAGRDLCDHERDGGHDDSCRHNHSPAEAAGPPAGKICVTAKGNDLDAEVDPNFGRAGYFVIVDPETLDFEAYENAYADLAHGAGIQSAQFVAGRDISAVLTGQVGPNARRVLDSAGIKVISVEACTIREALAWLKAR
jgi:predicted Fe-Mo cluster-binding NifX family protein